MDVRSKVKKSSGGKGLLSAVGLLLALTVLASVSDAASPGATTAGLAIGMQKAMTLVLVGPPASAGGVIVPPKPVARSPFQPPVWTPPTPPTPPGRPSARPVWANK